MKPSPIGIFDSGYGGLTVFKDIAQLLPQYDYVYLGDNARTPYGSRSFETVYQYTLQAVEWLFLQGCPLIILACNTASAKALRTIQQNDLPKLGNDKRVLGVIRPTAEKIGEMTHSNQVGILATAGTVASQSYPIEIKKFFPQVQVHQQACPLWVPLIENNAFDNTGADYFFQENINSLLQQNKNIDTVLLACTHYPIILQKIEKLLPAGVQVLAQGQIVANSLDDYLHRHPEVETKISKNKLRHFYTTDDAQNFNEHSSLFFGSKIIAEQIHFT